MKEFGTNRIIGNKRIITLRYTDMELSSRVVKFLHQNGYRIGEDYTVIEYYGRKGIKTSRIEAIILSNHIMPIMAIKQRRVAEIAVKKAVQLECEFF